MTGTPAEFPHDDTGDALKRLQANGDDLSRERDVDFTVVLSSETTGSRFKEHFDQLGYKVSIKKSGCVADSPWDVLVVNRMVPSHDGITALSKLFKQSLMDLVAGMMGRDVLRKMTKQSRLTVPREHGDLHYQTVR